MKNQPFNIIEASKNLRISILKSIKKEEMKSAIYKIVLNSILSLVSVSFAVVFVINIFKDAFQSGLSEYLSLLLSDGSLVASYWQAYVMSVIESLPIIQITFVVASIWVFTWSISRIVEAFGRYRSAFYKIS